MYVFPIPLSSNKSILFTQWASFSGFCDPLGAAMSHSRIQTEISTSLSNDLRCLCLPWFDCGSCPVSRITEVQFKMHRMVWEAFPGMDDNACSADCTTFPTPSIWSLIHFWMVRDTTTMLWQQKWELDPFNISWIKFLQASQGGFWWLFKNKLSSWYLVSEEGLSTK